MFSVLKKIFLFSSIVILLSLLVSICLVVIYEDKLIDQFKKQIIDRASIKIDFSKIDFSLFQNFPYGSVIMDNATIYYPDNIHDTLISCNKLSLSINLVSVLKGYYNISEISISNGMVNIEYNKFENLFESKSSENNRNTLLIETKKLVLNNCLIKYRYGKRLELKLLVLKSSLSGILKNNTFKLKLNLLSNKVWIKFNSVEYDFNRSLNVSTKILGNTNGFFSEQGLLKINSLPFDFSTKYTYSDDVINLQLSSSKLNISRLAFILTGKTFNTIDKGTISFNASYNACIDKIESQKMSINYQLKNVTLNINEEPLILSSLNGTTYFYGGLENNSTEVNKFSLSYAGAEFNGFGKIKNYPKPYVIFDTKITSLKQLTIFKDFSLSGHIEGNIKSLIKLDDIYNLNINNIKIIKLNSSIKFSDLSIKNNDQIKNLSGDLLVNDNVLKITSKGILLQSAFKGSLVIPNLIEVLYKKKPISPTINLDIDNLNVDEFIKNNNKSKGLDSIDFNLIGNVNNLYYQGNCFNNFKVKASSRDNFLTVDSFSMLAFSGNIAGKFHQLEKNRASMSVYFQSIDIKNVFKTFNSFGQTTLTHENLSGNLSGKLNLMLNLDNNSKIIPKSIILESDLYIENGTLTGMSQFKQLSKVLKLNEKESIKFKTLHNSISINNGLVSIPVMDISSNAMSIQLSGEHNFNGQYTYWLKVNLKEILARRFLSNKDNNADYEDNKMGGLNLFFKIVGNSDSFKISYDKKNAVKHLQGNLNNEGQLLKEIIKNEFNFKVKDTSLNRANSDPENKKDSLYNKTQKKAFRIEWDEIDTTKQD